jgi:hypothetical protein
VAKNKANIMKGKSKKGKGKNPQVHRDLQG